MFDYMMTVNHFSEAAAARQIKQMLGAIHYMHSYGASYSLKFITSLTYNRLRKVLTTLYFNATYFMSQLSNVRAVLRRNCTPGS